MSTPKAARQDKIAELAREMRLMSSFDALHSHAVAERVGMHPTDIETMDLLNTLGPMTAGERGRRTGLPTGATTRLIDRMERAGYVRRQPDETDRRRVIVEPIDENLGPIGALFQPLIDGLTKLWRSLDPEDLETVTRFIRETNEVTAEVNARLRSGDAG